MNYGRSDPKGLDKIWLTIKSGGFKQAQQVLEKKLKKSGNDIELKVMNVLLDLRKGSCYGLFESKRWQDIKAQSASSASESSSWTVVASIMVEYGLHKELDDYICEIAKNEPRNGTIALTWLRIALLENLPSLPRAALNFIKFSSKRPAISLLAMCNSMSVSSKDFKLGSQLALRHLERHEPFEDTQELFAEVLLLCKCEKYEDVLKMKEKYPQLTLPAIDLLYIEAMQKLYSPEQLFDYYYKNLQDSVPNSLDNFYIWTDALNLCTKDSSLVPRFKSLMEFDNRNAALIRVHYANQFNEDISVPVQNYFKMYGGRAKAVFTDLKPFITPHLVEILQETKFGTKMAQMIADSTISRFKKYLNIDESTETLLLSYDKYTSLLSNKLVTDYHAADIFLIQAAQTLVQSNSPESVLASIGLLKYCNENDPQEFNVILALIRLHSHFGSPNCALALADSLSIRNVQSDCLSHLYLSRSSTVIPNFAAAEIPLSRRLDIAMSIYEHIPLSHTVAGWTDVEFSGLDDFISRNASSQLEGARDFIHTLERSITKNILSIERRRVNGLTQVVPTFEDAYQFADKRDSKCTPDFGVSWPGESIGAAWVQKQKLLDALWGAIRSPATCKDIADKLAKSSTDGCTQWETWAAEVSVEFARQNPKTSGPKALEAFPQVPDDLLVEWRSTHAVMVALDLLEKLKAFVKTKDESFVALVQNLRKTVDRMVNRLDDDLPQRALSLLSFPCLKEHISTIKYFIENAVNDRRKCIDSLRTRIDSFA
ncbi:hypothetical protein CANCADRAFT_4211 [Tortispora caseinolytica NRRL Y-17796]|uniref:N-terminal acetyltransferase B complex subunit MDM20 n=1 Tax=Tortispora caseinolytica NRRL Y-17796 TaxID=767744 RepID=A0A1E4TD08_9ASCO|nr:hypothetical protein CANCADRAFT_4211 [Tortispora caseinolytica NRRL Y-17796]